MGWLNIFIDSWNPFLSHTPTQLIGPQHCLWLYWVFELLWNKTFSVLQQSLCTVWPYASHGEFLASTTNISTPDQTNYATKLKTAMQKLKAIPPCQPKHQHINVSDLLHTCTHVFVWHDAIRKLLQAPYDGPYEVVTRNKKHFTVNIKGCKEVTSVDWLKPAYLDLSQMHC